MDAAMGRALFGTVFFFVTLALLSSPAMAESVNVTSCGVLNVSGNTYIITAGFNAAVSPCLVVEGDNIVLSDADRIDMDIIGSGDGIAVHVRNGRNVSVNNVDVSDFDRGFFLESGDELFINGNSVSDSTEGFFILNVSESDFVSNFFMQTASSGERGEGFTIEDSFNNNFEYFFSDTFDGLALKSVRSDNNTYGVMTSFYSDGIVFEDSSYNIFRDSSVDTVGRDGISVLGNSNNNLFSNMIVSNAVRAGVLVEGSGNRFFNSSILSAGEVAVNIEGASGNIFELLLVRDTLSGQDLQMSGASGTQFIDSSLGNYNLMNSDIIIKRSGVGQMAFLENISVAGNFSSDFVFAPNSFVFSGSDGLSNKSVEVTLEGLPAGRINHRIMRDGSVCASDICAAIDIDEVTAIFRVNQFGAYSIASDDAPASSNSGNTNSGGGGGGGGSNTRITPLNTVTPLSNTNSTPIADNTNSTTEGVPEIAPITGGFIGFVKRPFVWVVVFLAAIIAAFLFVRARSDKMDDAAAQNAKN